MRNECYDTPSGRPVWIWTLLLILIPGGLFMLGLSIASFSDSFQIFQNRHMPKPESLETVTFKIICASPTTPNFKVLLSDGKSAFYSFPNYLFLNPRAGLHFYQITEKDSQALIDCEATAKLSTVHSVFRTEKQIWDLNCSRAGIHYGADVAGSYVSDAPIKTLLFHLVLSMMIFLIGFYMLLVVRALLKSNY